MGDPSSGSESTLVVVEVGRDGSSRVCVVDSSEEVKVGMYGSALAGGISVEMV